MSKGMPEQPYVYEEVCFIEKRYNPKYGDNRVCGCGHTYYRHFDTYENMAFVGCKYCRCAEFKEKHRRKPKTK